VARRAAYIRSVLAEDGNVVLLDAGNVFGDPGLQGQLKAEVSVKAMEMMSYDAINLGSHELNYGDSFLRGDEFICDSSRSVTIPAISANIVHEDTGATITAPHKIIEFDLYTVGITGIVAKEYEETILSANQINDRTVTVIDEETALNGAVIALRDEVDILVVLADVPYDQCRSLAQKTEGIDLMVCTSGVSMNEEPEQVNGVYVVQGGYEGQTIGNLTLTIGKEHRIRTAEGTVITLDDTIDDNQPDVLALLNEYYTCLEEHKEALLNDEQKDPVEGGFYTGYAACRNCHRQQTDQWLSTAHARAFTTLTLQSQDYNPECIPCHTTGFSYTGGFIMPDLTSEMGGVQCEMCHGAGGDHAHNESVSLGIIPQDICTTCHTPGRSPQFDYPTYYRAIQH
jgi:hypothetical protein